MYKRPTTPWLAALICILLLVLVPFYWVWLTGRASFYIFDFMYGWEPYLRFIGGQLAQGRWPTWNPYALCGVPQIAFMAPSPFYPGNWLFAAMPFANAVAWNLVFNQLVAGIGMFLLVSALGWGAVPALMAAVSYSLCGTLFSLQNTYPLQATAAWLPVCASALLGVGGARNRGVKSRQDMARLHLVGFVAVAISTYMLVSAGVPEIAAPCLLGLVAFCAGNYVRHQRLKVLVWQGMALGLGVVMCMPQILPLIEWLRLSPRASGMQSFEALRWSAGWYDVVGMALGLPFGNPYDVGNSMRFMVRPESEPYLVSAFFGAPVLTAAIWGAFDRTWQYRWWLIGSAVVAVLLALGANFPPIELLSYSTQWFSAIRYPIKLLVVAAFCIVLLAARGLMSNDLGDLRRSSVFTVAVWIAALVFGLLLQTQTISPTSLSALFVGRSASPPLLEIAANLLGLSIVSAGAFGVVTAAIGILHARGSISYATFAPSVVLLAAGQLISFACLNERFPGDSNFFHTNVAMADKVRRLSGNAPGLLRVATLYNGLEAPAVMLASKDCTQSEYQYCRQIMVRPTSMDARVAPTVYVTLGQTADNFQVVANALHELLRRNSLPLSTFCRISNTPFVLTQSHMLERGVIGKPLPLLEKTYFRLREDNNVWNIRIYETIDVLPRLFFARQLQWPKSHEAAIDELVSGRVDPGIFTLMEGQHDASEEWRTYSIGEPGVSPAHAGIVQELDNAITIRATTTVANYLVLSDEYYPGWQAYVDGNPTPIFRANGMYRAVLVPAGEHTITYRFQPSSLVVGLGMALVALLLLAAMTLEIARRTTSVN